MAERKEATQASCYTRCTYKYTQWVLSIQGWLSRVNGSIGVGVSRRPVLVAVLSVLAAGAAGVGWVRFRIETAGDKLWVPQESKAMKDHDWAKTQYSSEGGNAQFLASVLKTRQNEYGTNALQLPIFWEMFHLDKQIRSIVVDDGGKALTWEDVCEQNFDGDCKYSGPLNFWAMSFETYLAGVNGSADDPTAGSREWLIATVNQQRFPDNTSVSTLSLFGGITLTTFETAEPDQPPLYMSSAEVISVVYTLRNGLGGVRNKWYNKFLDVLEEWCNGRAKYMSLAFIAGNSVDNEIGRSVTNDLYLIVISVAIFVLVSILGMSRLHRVATRSSLALLGVLSAVIAMIAGYGLSLLFNCPFNTLSQTLPYVLLGLAVDCMFILVKSYDGAVAADPSASLESRFRSLMSGTGTNVVVTLLVSAVAFALGAISELPAVLWFSVYATMGVVCIGIAMMTFFTGCFVLTERRIATNRIDCFCCATSDQPPPPTAACSYFDEINTATTAAIPSAKRALELPKSGCTTPTTTAANSILEGGPGSALAAGYASLPPAVIMNPDPASASLPPATQQMVQPPQQRGGALGEAVQGADVGQHQLPHQPSAFQSGPLSDARQQQLQRSQHLKPYEKQQQQQQHGTVAATEMNLMKKVFGRYYAPFLTRWYVKVAVLAMFIGWIVVSGVGIPELEEGQPLSELAPDDSYLQDYVKIVSDTFQQQIGSPSELYFRGFDPAPPPKQASMLRALGRVLDDKFTNATISAFQGNWLIDYIDWVQTTHPEVELVKLEGCSNPYIGRVTGDLGLFLQPTSITGCVPEDQFLPLLLKFLETSRSYREDVRFLNSTAPDGSIVPGSVWSSRFPIVHTAPGDDGSYSRESLEAVRQLEKNINRGIFKDDNEAAVRGNVFFMYNENYIYGEGDAILGIMTIEYILLAVAGVGLVLVLTLPSARAVILMMVAVGMVDYFLFGEMFVLNIRFNQVSIINMIMATGLSVDYAVYFAQRFVMLTADGSLNGRMVQAMADTGSAVFMGGLTALAGTIPLAFATSTILRTFFALIFGTIVFALLVGLMLMPVIFSLVGPPPLQMLTQGDAASVSSPPLPPSPSSPSTADATVAKTGGAAVAVSWPQVNAASNKGCVAEGESVGEGIKGLGRQHGLDRDRGADAV